MQSIPPLDTVAKLKEGQGILVKADIAAIDVENQCVMCLVKGLAEEQTLCKVPLSAIFVVVNPPK